MVWGAYAQGRENVRRQKYQVQVAHKCSGRMQMSRNENGWSEMSASYICLGGWVTPVRQANDDVTVIENTLATRNGE